MCVCVCVCVCERESVCVCVCSDSDASEIGVFQVAEVPTNRYEYPMPKKVGCKKGQKLDPVS